MQKLFSLDLINSESFEFDIVNSLGEKLFFEGDKITKDSLLKLYFKEVYASKKPPPQEIIQEPQEEAFVAQEEQVAQANAFYEERFDKGHAQEVLDLSLKIAELAGMSQYDLVKLKEAAYYHDVYSALESQDEDSIYEYLTKELRLSAQTADSVIKCHKKYDIEDFVLSDETILDIPPYHVIAIADFYTKISATMSKEEALNTILRVGSSKFNIFVLHKFLYYMRSLDE